MKHIILCFLLSVAFFSCKTTDIVPQPEGKVIPEAVGQWLYGTFSMSDFWTYDGDYVGNPFELAVAFSFTADGKYEQYFMSSALDYSCKTEAFSYYTGTVIFNTENSSFTVYPSEGNYRGYYSCFPNKNFDREASGDELKEQTFYYSFETDTAGKKWMVIRFDPADEYPSYFAPTSW